MKAKSVIGNKLSFLIVGVLGIFAFARGHEQIWLLTGVFGIWGIWTIWDLLRAGPKKIKASIREKRERKKHEKGKTQTGRAEGAEEYESVSAALSRQMNCRISEYIHSVYPGATWEWREGTPERIAMDGGTGKIELFGISDFNYADVSMDQFARFNLDMIRVVPFTDLFGVAEKASVEIPEEYGVDPEIWYDLQGKKILEDCVADLNSHGHTSLSIKENGDICFTRDGTEITLDSFRSFPGKTNWLGITQVIESQGLYASVEDDRVAVSW